MAYGSIAAPALALDADLPVFSYSLPNGLELTTHAVHGEADEGVMRYLYGVFDTELEGESGVRAGGGRCVILELGETQ